MVEMNTKWLKGLFKNKNYKQFNDYIVDYVDFYYGNDFSARFEPTRTLPIFTYYWDWGFEGETEVTFCDKQSIYTFDWSSQKIIIQYSDVEELINHIRHMISFCSGDELDEEDKLSRVYGSDVYEDFIDYLKENDDYIEDDELSEKQKTELLNWYEDYLRIGEK